MKTTPLTVVLMPVKAFADAKGRLAPALDPAERARLAETFASRVLAAAHPLQVMVVTDDQAVARWADRCGARMLWRPAQGLNDAVSHGVARLATEGVDRVIVAHADLPKATRLAHVGEFDGITLVPDRHLDGTNVLCVPARSGFKFSYGPGSFKRHVAEAERLGLPVRVLDDEDLAWDVDLPEDLNY